MIVFAIRTESPPSDCGKSNVGSMVFRSEGITRHSAAPHFKIQMALQYQNVKQSKR